MRASFVLKDRSDRELLLGIQEAIARECEDLAIVVAHLAEMDRRELFKAEGYSSLFKYCVEVLHLSESQTYLRIDVARVAQKYPIVFEMLADGLVQLSAVHRLGPALTDENHKELLKEAVHKSKEKVEEIVARLRPKPAVPSVVRKLPNARLEEMAASGEMGSFDSQNGSTEVLESPPQGSTPEQQSKPVEVKASHRPVVSPLAPEIHKVQFTISTATRQKLERAQELLRHRVPNGDVGAIFELGLELLLEEASRERFAKVKQPRTFSSAKASTLVVGDADASTESPTAEPEPAMQSRHIPHQVKRAVWDRDQGRCAFVSKSGKRCSERNWIEYHHVVPFAWGGEATIENIQLRCRTHNAYEGELIFGKVRRRGRWSAVGTTGSGTSSAVSPEELVLEPVSNEAAALTGSGTS